MAAPTTPSIAELAGRGKSALLTEWLKQERRVEDTGALGLPEWNYVDWLWSDPQPTLAHGDWLRINGVSGVDDFPGVVLPDALPVGSRVVVADYQNGSDPQSGHTGGMGFTSAHTIADPETLYDADYSVPAWEKWFSGGAPAAKGNAAMFTRTSTGWTIQCRPLGTPWAPHAVDNTPFTAGKAWVNPYGHCPRDEGNDGSPIGWKPRVGNRYATFYSIQEAYDNGATTFIVAKQVGGGSPWSPGGLIIDGAMASLENTPTVLTFIGEESDVEIGTITCGARIANKTYDPDYGDTTWAAPTPEAGINIVGSENIIFTGIEYTGADGAAGEPVGSGNPGNPGGKGVGVKILVTNGIGAPCNATAIGGAGGPGGTGAPSIGEEDNGGVGYDGGPGGDGGSVVVVLTNCTNITAVRTPGAAGAGGAGGAGSTAQDGATGTPGSAGTST